jgi:hypothetical protein
LILTGVTAVVVIAVSLLSAVFCAICAVVCSKKSRALAADVRFRTSTLEELHAMRDYVAKIDAWSHRINQRLLKTRGPEQTPAPNSAPTTKDDLRRRVGIVPGKPAPHA